MKGDIISVQGRKSVVMDSNACHMAYMFLEPDEEGNWIPAGGMVARMYVSHPRHILVETTEALRGIGE